ncbi:MAG: mannosyl-glycoprotein endo-beta-N-acetylglucosamidase [Thermovibrio sp.]|nr:MAG: mannosyl-glycoprotein endo-beta-N-acetylglucosamidase [Thermovibrio sp.]
MQNLLSFFPDKYIKASKFPVGNLEVKVKKVWLFIFLGFVLGILANSLFQIEKGADGYQVLHEKKVILKPIEIPSHVSLKGLPTSERKKEFVRILLPLIRMANREVLNERKLIIEVAKKAKLSDLEKERLSFLMKKYRAENIDELLKRVNTVPPSLILAQGAIESGWGTSRFFTEANNIFGVYSFKGARCMKAKYSNACLKVYDNLLDSIRDYIYNLNISWAYRRFRELRAEGADVHTLVKSLDLYSTKREEYEELVWKIIVKNNLQRFDSIELASSSLQLTE